MRQCEKCHGNALALLKCCWLVPLEKTNKILWRYLRTEFDPLNSRDTTPLLLMVCFAGTPRFKHYVHVAAITSGEARMSLQCPHSDWKWECNILEGRNVKAERDEQQCVPWLRTGILSRYSKSFWTPPKISEISHSQGLVHAYHSFRNSNSFLSWIKILHLFTDWLRKPSPLIPSPLWHLKGCKCLEPDSLLILEPHTSW